MGYQVTTVHSPAHTYFDARRTAPALDNRLVVKYRPIEGFAIEVGHSATIIPLDHYNTWAVTNGRVAFTSKVTLYDADSGDFETKNTIYVKDVSTVH